MLLLLKFIFNLFFCFMFYVSFCICISIYYLFFIYFNLKYIYPFNVMYFIHLCIFLFICITIRLKIILERRRHFTVLWLTSTGLECSVVIYIIYIVWRWRDDGMAIPSSSTLHPLPSVLLLFSSLHLSFFFFISSSFLLFSSLRNFLNCHSFLLYLTSHFISSSCRSTSTSFLYFISTFYPDIFRPYRSTCEAVVPWRLFLVLSWRACSSIEYTTGCA